MNQLQTKTDRSDLSTELAAPVPVLSGAQMAATFKAHRDVQHAIDGAYPESLVRLDGKIFRTKTNWRATSVAYHVTVTVERDERIVLDGEPDNYMWIVTCRATAPNGRSVVGDGACSAAEKYRGRLRPTEHNVRSHAHTRAFNRAISNLVGFGEVSAEEIEDTPPPQARKASPQKAAATITAPQRARLFAIAAEVWPADQYGPERSKSELRDVLQSQGIESTSDIPTMEYDRIVSLVQSYGQAEQHD